MRLPVSVETLACSLREPPSGLCDAPPPAALPTFLAIPQQVAVGHLALGCF